MYIFFSPNTKLTIFFSLQTLFMYPDPCERVEKNSLVKKEFNLSNYNKKKKTFDAVIGKS